MGNNNLHSQFSPTEETAEITASSSQDVICDKLNLSVCPSVSHLAHGLFEGLFDPLPLGDGAMCQDLDDGGLVGACMWDKEEPDVFFCWFSEQDLHVALTARTAATVMTSLLSGYYLQLINKH